MTSSSQDNSNHDQSKPKWTPPDEMWIRQDHLTWCPDGENNDFEYLLATPQRKAAPELYEALERAVAIIREHVPEDALGQGGGICPEPGMPDQTWPMKEEELYYFDRALAKARGEDQ